MCLFSVVMFALVPFSHQIGKHPEVRRDWIYISRSVGTHGYDLLWGEDDYKEPHFVLICQTLGFEPPFDQGEVAKWFQYRDFGDCWDMSKIPSWDMLRDSNRELIRMDEKEFRSWLQTKREIATR